MNTLINRLLPHCPVGLLFRYDGQRFHLEGYEGGAEPLEHIRSEWPAIAREEAHLRLRLGYEEQAASLRPADFPDLSAKASLGRLKPEEADRLNAYYDALESLNAERSRLEARIAEADVRTLNALEWPEWVSWEPIPATPLWAGIHPAQTEERKS